MAAKQEASYFVYPTNASEKDQAYAVFKFAKENNIARPQYIDADGTVWRWDNKGGGKHDGHRLMRTAIKYNRNARDRARRLDQSLTEADFEEAWPGKGRDLFRAEKERQDQIAASRQDGEDIDHFWSLNSGGFHVSNNLRPQQSELNRSEGDRGAPHPLEQAAYMLAETKADQVRMQGPRMAPDMTTSITFDRGKAVLNYISRATNAVQNGIDMFMFGQNGGELVEAVADSELMGNPVFNTNINGVAVGANDPTTDVGKRAGDAIGNGIKNGVEALKNGSKINGDTNGITTM